MNGLNGYPSRYEGTEVDAAVERVQGIDTELASKVDKTTTINNIPLTGDVTLTAADVGSISSSTTYGKSIAWEDNVLYLKDQDGRTLNSQYLGVNSTEWGFIYGDIGDQTDLQEALDEKSSVIIRDWSS